MSKAKKIIIGILRTIAVIISVCSVIYTAVTLTVHFLTNPSEPPPTGLISQNGSDVLRIYDRSTGKEYSSFVFLDNDGIVVEKDIKRGWDLVPQKSGRCGIAIETYFIDVIENVVVYDIVVDENLCISFTSRKNNIFLPYKDISFDSCQMTAQKDENSIVIPQQTAIEIGNEMSIIYGREEHFNQAPDLSKCVKVNCTHELDYTYVVEFYISEEKMYYCNILAGREHWYEFTPDEFCSLDRINKLLDLKD